MSNAFAEKSVHCAVCRGTGWEYVAGKGVRRCDCQTGGRREKLLKESRIPSRYLTCSLEGYQPQGEPLSSAFLSQVKAHKQAASFALDYPDVETGLLFTGPCGVGKTHLTIAILNSLVQRKGVQCLFYDFRDLLKEIQSSYSPQTETTESEILTNVINAEVLALDELGAGKPTDWALDTMTYIVTRRYNERRLTLFTSNYLDATGQAGEELLVDRIGVRLRSRLYEMCQTVVVEGADYRRRIHDQRLRRLAGN